MKKKAAIIFIIGFVVAYFSIGKQTKTLFFIHNIFNDKLDLLYAQPIERDIKREPLKTGYDFRFAEHKFRFPFKVTPNVKETEEFAILGVQKNLLVMIEKYENVFNNHLHKIKIGLNYKTIDDLNQYFSTNFSNEFELTKTSMSVKPSFKSIFLSKRDAELLLIKSTIKWSHVSYGHPSEHIYFFEVGETKGFQIGDLDIKKEINDITLWLFPKKRDEIKIHLMSYEKDLTQDQIDGVISFFEEHR